MRLTTFLPPGSETPRAGEVREDGGELRVYAYAQEELTVLDRLADPEAVPVEGHTWALDEVTLLSPCAPSKIVALWNNFHALAAKLEKAVPEHPLFLIKPGSSVAGPGTAIARPAASRSDTA